jgi:hypothetical protein
MSRTKHPVFGEGTLPRKSSSERKQATHMRYGARALVALWAGLWIYLAISSYITQSIGRVSATLVLGLCSLLLFSAVIPWFWEGVGGIVLVTESLLAAIAFSAGSQSMGYSLTQVIFGIFAIAAPPLVAGFLFLQSWNRSRQHDLKR